MPSIPLEKLRWRCDPDTLGFQTTEELPPFEGIIGQERAEKALQLGVEIGRAGYNIYVCGATGTGRFTAVQRVLATWHAGGPPPDLCYVFHFQHPERPQLLTVPAGEGKLLRKAMEGLITDLKRDIPQTLASENVQQRKQMLLRQAQRRERRLLQQYEHRLPQHFGFRWHETDSSLLPELALKLDGCSVPLTDLEERLDTGQVTPEAYKRLHRQYVEISTELTSVFADVRRLRHDTQEALRTLERALVRPIMQQAVARAAAAVTDAAVLQYFREVEDALLEDVERFHEIPTPSCHEANANQAQPTAGYEEDPFQEYQVNVIVDNSETTGPPVIFETSPTYKNLFGTIEPALEYGGVWRSDYTGIRAGAVHRANGGYLIFNAHDALSEPIVWSTLRRLLQYGQMEIQAYDHHTLMPSTSLKPEPIPCQVKVLMLGDEELYDALAAEDAAFKRLFKIKADFDMTIPRQHRTIAQYAGFIRRICQEEHLRPFDRLAVAAVVEFGVRLAGRQNKLSARLEVIADVLREADYWAGKAGVPTVSRAEVERALRERLARVAMLEEHLHEVIAEGLLLITTHGAVVGQVNGLAVYQLDEDYAFGCPMRITAETSMGDAGVVNIEREVSLGDASHNKGVLILSGYLRHAYARDKPIILSASLCIEQSYEGIAGDSASAAEMYALLSSLAELPIDQGTAVTGSVNQKGELQPISGINEKIEGFFDVCLQQGLSGTQGVIMPQANVDDLMLRQDIIDAVAAGQFSLYAVTHIDEGFPLLTGVAAGKWQHGQGYPPDSVNGRIDARLRRFAAQWFGWQHGVGTEGPYAVPARATTEL